MTGTDTAFRAGTIVMAASKQKGYSAEGGVGNALKKAASANGYAPLFCP